MEENKKKVVVTLVMGIMLLLALVISATYAYFQIMTSGSSSTLITGSTPQGSNVSVKELLGELHLNLSASDMAYANQGDYYADDEDNYVKTQDAGTHDIAEVQLVGDTQTYSCTGTLDITMDINEENSMGAAIQKEDLFLHLEGAGLNETIDMFNIKTTGTTSYDLDFEITGGTKEIIKAYAKLINKSTDQKYLANKNLSINISISNVNCGIDNSFNSKDIIAKKGSGGLSSELVGGMYRYQGQCTGGSGDTPCEGIVDNYICFGTDDKCTETDDYMYRIIGITEDGQIKVIKNTALVDLNPEVSGYPTRIRWHNNSKQDVKWSETDLYKRLNGLAENNVFVDSENSAYSYMKKSTEEEPNKWYDMIENHIWPLYKIIDVDNHPSSDSLYNVEQGLSTQTYSSEAKISLMYLHDYYYTVPQSNYQCHTSNEGTREECKKSWMNTINNGKEDSYTEELTMSKSSTTSVWSMTQYGSSGNFGQEAIQEVRPVFYLQSGLNITGSGTIADPYMIKDSKELKFRDKLVKLNLDAGLSNDLIGGMYRYQGQCTGGSGDTPCEGIVDNYICFGTDDKCTETDDYMYRIIGITEDGQIKVIKNTALVDLNPGISGSPTRIQWHSNYKQNVTWSETDLYKRLNGLAENNVFVDSENSAYSYMKKSTEEEPNKWYDIIENHIWPYKEVSYNGHPGSDDLYKREQGLSVEAYRSQAKISLMYLHDYYYTVPQSGYKCYSQDDGIRAECKKSWMHRVNNGIENSYGQELTMIKESSTSVWSITEYGSNYFSQDAHQEVRPVFYLQSGLDISGSGTIEDPFVINLD